MDSLEILCQEPIWNKSVSWNSTNPNFSKCFRHTFLIWIPCLFLLIFGSLELLPPLICNRMSWKPRRPSTITRFKILLILVLMILVISEVTAEFQIDNLTTTIDCLFYGVFLIMLVAECSMVCMERCVLKKSSSSSPAYQLVFWVILAACLTPNAKMAMETLIETATFLDISAIVSACCQILQPVTCFVILILEHFPCNTTNSEDSVSFMSKLWFAWLNPIFKLGYQNKILDDSDLPSLDDKDDATMGNILRRWKSNWHKRGDKKRGHNIVPILAGAFAPDLLLGAALKLLADMVYISLPLILRSFIQELSNNEYNWKSYFWATMLLIVNSIHVTSLGQYYYYTYTCGLKMRAALFSAIYKKSLNVSHCQKSRFTEGSVSNYLSVDCHRFAMAVQFLHVLWSGPLQILVAAIFLYDMIGVSTFIGLAVLSLSIPINILSMKYAKKLEKKLMVTRDKRIHLLNEIVRGIKAIKLYAWEIPFLKKLGELRDLEVGYLKKCAIFWANMYVIYGMSPTIVTIVTLASYVYIDPENNTLTADKLFACMALFNIIRIPLYQLPVGIMDVIKVGISVKRINAFLNCQEIDDNVIGEGTDSSENAVEVHDASISWDDQKLILRDINLKIKKGSLVAILGMVGSGKTSLLSGMLGEAILARGRICKSGNISYVPQKAWVQNLTVKDNIIFGRKLDVKKYSSTLKGCALMLYVSGLPAGDMTEIGENGVNLSGGQKQRLNLARAVYGSEDIVLLDDPFSALDGHVAEHIFNNAIGPKGILRNKTRILTTHNVSFLEQMDQIILLDNGNIIADGKYKEMMKSNKFFIKYIESTYSSKKEEPLLMSEEDNGHDVTATSKNNEEKGNLVESEVSFTGRVDVKHFLHLFKKANIYMCLFALSMAICASISNLYITILLSKWTNQMSTSIESMISHEDFTTFIQKCVLMIVLQAAFSFLDYITHFRRCAHASGVIHNQALESVLSSPMLFFQSNPTGRIINRLSSDVDTIDDRIPRELANIKYAVVHLLVIFCFIAYLIPLFLIFVVAVTVFCWLLQVYYARTKRQLQRMEAVRKSTILSHYLETTQGFSVVRAFAVQKRFIEENIKRVERHLICSYINAVGSTWLAIRVRMLGAVMVFMAAILATYHKSTDNISTGIVSLIVTLSLTILDEMEFLVTRYSELESDSVSLERLREYDKLKSEGEWFSESDMEWELCKELQVSQGTISFENYSTRYRPMVDNVIEDMTLYMRNEEKIGICGRTGAEKSSLINALLRILEPTSGRLLIGGMDVMKLGLQELRSKITVVPQDPVLFSGSLRFNLDPIDSFSDDEIWEALKHVHLDKNVLDQGLDQEVGEGGSRYSVGQRQRICLARALLRKCKILILDEATAAMDSVSDEAIQRMISEEFKICTVLTVAHRLHTIMRSDRIVVMDKGKMVECGEPRELLERKDTHFFKMCKDVGLA